MKAFTTDEDESLIETKLVDILEDFQLESNTTLEIVKQKEEGSLTLVNTTAKTKQSVNFDSSENTKLPNWTISPYDLGGHSPYFNSHKIFASNSSIFFLLFR